jgi:hypothetical protein
MAFILTRIKVGDYDRWKAGFDQDLPRARAEALNWRVFRAVDEPDEVLIQIEFRTLDEAKRSRDRLLASGVLDRFAVKHGPIVAEEAEHVELNAARHEAR